GPHGTIGHALDRSDGRGHRQAEGHIPQRRLRSVLALPHPKRPGTPASGRQMERRRKVVTPILFDREPHLPRRSPLDIAAQVGWVSVNWIVAHRFLSSLIVILIVFWSAWAIRRRMGSETLLTRKP